MTDDVPSMIDGSDGELLSAFVDDELTGEQRAEVEARLLNDPAARQWVDQLRALSTALRALPRETVGQDLRTKVLERGEKTLADDRRLAPRRWMWAALAVAAALVLTIALPQTAPREEQPRLAKKDSVADRRLDARASGGLAEGEVGRTEGQTSAPTMRAGKQDAAVADVDAVDAVVAESALGNLHLDDAGGERNKNVGGLGRGVAAGGGKGGVIFKSSQAEYDVQVTFTRADKFTKLLADQRVSYRYLPASREAQRGGGRASERLLVEGTNEQLERVLAACHADTLNCRSLRVAGTAPGVEQPEAWNRWQRQDSLAQNGSSRESRLETDEVAAAPASQTETDRYREASRPQEALDGSGVQRPIEDAVRQTEPRAVAKAASSEPTPSAATRSAAAPAERPVRVLFFLRLAPVGDP